LTGVLDLLYFTIAAIDKIFSSVILLLEIETTNEEGLDKGILENDKI